MEDCEAVMNESDSVTVMAMDEGSDTDTELMDTVNSDGLSSSVLAESATLASGVT